MAFRSLQIASGKHSAPLLPPSATNKQYQQSCADPEGGGGQGFRTSILKNHKDIGFLSNTGPNPRKTKKTIKPVS